MLGVAARGRRPRPPSGVPRDEVGARAGPAARRRPAPPRARRRLPRRARREGPCARARLRRHRLRDGRDALGRRAPPLRPRVVRAARSPRPDPAAGRRSGDPRAVARRRRPSRAAGLPSAGHAGRVVRESLKANAPLSSGMGRLFDAVAARPRRPRARDLRGPGGHRARAACRRAPLPSRLPGAFGDSTDLVAPCYLAAAAGRRSRPRSPPPSTRRWRPRPRPPAPRRACPDRRASPAARFQNLRLLALDARRLEALGFRVLTHRLVPPNDGGISYGQAAVAARGSRHVPRHPRADRGDRRARGRQGRDLRCSPGGLDRALPRGGCRRLGPGSRRLRARAIDEEEARGRWRCSRRWRGVRPGGRRDPGERGA